MKLVYMLLLAVALSIGMAGADYVFPATSTFPGVTSFPGMTTNASPVSAVSASYTTVMNGANNDIVITANPTNYGGTLGNAIDFILTDPGEESGIVVDADPETGVINITLSSTASPTINTTANALIEAIEADENASAMISVALSGEDTGAGVVTALAKVDLSGGVNGTAGVTGEFRYYLNDLYYLYSGSTFADAAWMKWEGAATGATVLDLGAKDLTTTGDISGDNLDMSGDADIGGTINQVGDLGDLDTVEQGSVVGALNETVADIGIVESDLGANASRITDLEGYDLKMSIVAGGSAGNHTLTGVHVGDALGGVVYATKTAGNLTTLTDLMAEFTGSGKGIIDTNVIANGGGTATTGGYLLVSWMDKT